MKHFNPSFRADLKQYLALLDKQPDKLEKLLMKKCEHDEKKDFAYYKGGVDKLIHWGVFIQLRPGMIVRLAKLFPKTYKCQFERFLMGKILEANPLQSVDVGTKKINYIGASVESALLKLNLGQF